MKQVSFALVAVAALFAGCTGSDGGPSPGAIGAEATAELDDSVEGLSNETDANATVVPPMPRMFLGGCSLYWGVYPVPAGDVEPLLPDGFEGAPLGADGTQAVYLLAFVFNNATANATEVGSSVLFFAGFQVSPPSELQNDSVFNEHIGTFVSPGAEVAQTLAAWSAGGEGAVSTNIMPAGAGAGFSATIGGATIDFFTEATPANSMAGFAEGVAIRFWIVDDGAIVGEVWARFATGTTVGAGGSVFTATGAPAPFNRPGGAGLGFLWAASGVSWEFIPFEADAQG